MKSFTALLCTAALIVLLASGCSKEPEPPDAPAPPAQSEEAAEGTAGKLGSLSAFTAGTLDEGVFTQDDIAAKDVTVVNFWSLTCRPCIAELPDLAAFAAALPDTVQVVTVCLDGSGNEELAKSVLEDAGFAGVTLISGDGDLAALCGNLIYTPTTVFADSQGALVGDAVIGGQENLSETFLAGVNAVLEAGGKAAVSLEA